MSVSRVPPPVNGPVPAAFSRWLQASRPPGRPSGWTVRRWLLVIGAGFVLDALLERVPGVGPAEAADGMLAMIEAHDAAAN
jgi:hypothetical protein